MKWTITDANIALTYTSTTWERECGGVKQTLTVMAWDHDTMTLYAESVWEHVTERRKIDEHMRDYIHLDEDVTKYFNKTMFTGDAA
jgi:hypothetical protein